MAVVMELGDETPTALYRLYAASGVLLYIGISGNLKARFAQHAVDKRWWPEAARKTVEWHLTRDAAADAELVAIRTESPVHNVAGRTVIDLAPPKRPPGSDLESDILWLLHNAKGASQLRLGVGCVIWPELSVIQVADRLGLPRSTRYRLLCPPRRSASA